MGDSQCTSTTSQSGFKGKLNSLLTPVFLACLCFRFVIAVANFDQKNLISPTTAVLPGTFKGPITGALYHAGSRLTTSSDLLVRYFFSSDYENTAATAGVTRVFDLGGSVLAQASNNCLGSAFVSGITDLTYLVACVNSGMDSYHIDALNGVNVVKTALSLGSAHNLAFSKIFSSVAGSNLILSASSGGVQDSSLYLIDSSNLNIQIFKPALPTYSNSQRISEYLGSTVLVVGNYTKIVVWDRSSFGSSRLVDSGKTSDTILFNEETGAVFTIVPNGANTDLKRINLTGSTVVDLAVTSATSALSSLVPFKGYPYLMSSEPNGNCIRVYSDNLLVQIFTSCSMPKLNYNNFISTVEVADSFFYFGFGRSLSPFNFIPTTMHLGYCSKVTENAAANCLKCVQGYYLNPTNLCTSIPRGYGMDPATSSIRPCPLGCEECYDNFVVCQKCRNFEGYFQDPVSLSCIYKSNINDYYGGNLATGFIAPCQVSFCLDCKSDHSLCSGCQSNYFLVIENGTCSTNSVEGFGLQTLAGNSTVLVRCLNSNCGQCASSYSTCRKCKTGYYFLANDTSNCNKNTLQGYGVSSELAIDVCQDTNCEACFDDFKNCSQCRQSYFLLQQGDGSWRCKPKSRVELERAYFDNKNDRIIIEFKETLRPLDYRQLLLFVLADKFGTSIPHFKIRSVELDSILRKTLTIIIGFEQNCIDCLFSVLPGSGFITGESGNFYLDAVVVNPITTSVMAIDNFFDINQMQSAGKIMSSTVQAAAQLMILFGSSQVQLAKVMDEFELFLFFNGKRNALIDSFVTLFSFEAWNLLPNFMKVEESQVRCVPELNFSRQGRSCNLFNNHGSKLMGLIGIFLLVLMRQAGESLVRNCYRLKWTVRKTDSAALGSAGLAANQGKPGQDGEPLARMSVSRGATVIPLRRRFIQSNPLPLQPDDSPMQNCSGRDVSPDFDSLPELGEKKTKVNTGIRRSIPKEPRSLMNTMLEPVSMEDQSLQKMRTNRTELLPGQTMNSPLARCFDWTMLVRSFDSAQIDLLLFSMVNVGSVNQQPLHLIGALVSTLIILGYTWLFFRLMDTVWKLFRQQEELGRREEAGTLDAFLQEQTGCLQYLYDGYRFDSRGPQMLLVLSVPLLNMLRSGIELFFIAFLSGKGNLQLYILILFDGCFVAVLAKCCPYRVQARNIEDLIIRTTLIVVYIVYLIYQYVGIESIVKDRIFGWALVSLFLVIILTNYGPSTFGVLSICCRKHSQKQDSQNKNSEPKPTDCPNPGDQNISPKQNSVRRLTLSKKPQSSNLLLSNSEITPAVKFLPDRPSTAQMPPRFVIRDDQQKESDSPPQESVMEQGAPSTHRSTMQMAESSVLMMRENTKRANKVFIGSPQRLSKSGAQKISIAGNSGSRKASAYKGPWINNIIIHQANNFMQPPVHRKRKTSSSQRSIADRPPLEGKHNMSLLTSGHLSDESRLAKPKVESSTQL